MTNEVASRLDAAITMPQHVVYREFPAETVVLNLDTGKYHGLNPTAGRMLEVLKDAESIRAAAAQVAEEFDHPLEQVEVDICELCDALADRGLIEYR